MKSEETTATADWLGVFESVLNATRATFVEGKNSFWDYANPEHFSSLWKSLEDESVKNANRVLILWSQTPPDESLFPVSTVEHVSPLHWAACAAKKCPQIQVCVLDLNPTAHRSQYLYEHYLSCEKRRLPWVRVVQAAHLFGSEGINGEFQPDTTPVETEALQCRLFPQAERKRGLVLAGHFVDRIRNELTSPQNAESRHAISNIIGPMVLRSGRTLPGETSGFVFIKHGKKSDFPPAIRGTVSHRCALNSILRAAGLMCAQVSEDTSGSGTSADSTGWLALDHECEQAGFNPAELRITLVDDQWSQGWLAWLKEGLGTTPVELQVSPDPLFLLQLLKAAGSESQQFSLSLDILQNEKKSPKQDILLLDLRLFTGNSTAEREFLIALDDMLKSLSTSGRAGIDMLDLQVVRCRLEALGGSGSELSGADHARYVTLLPRLIAQLDFSLPIIIFSSTGQREVEKQLKNVPSVITDFSKPRHFQGADEEVVTRAEHALIESVENAIRWLRGRRLVQQIQARPLDKLEKARKRCAEYSHFELYFDESGISLSPRFRCAALLIGYSGGDKHTYASDAMLVHQLMEQRGLIWYPPSPGAVIGRDYLGKQRNEPREGRWSADEQWNEHVAAPLVSILGDRPVIPFAISRAQNAPSELEVDPTDLSHPDSLDNVYTDLLQLLLEVILVDVMPAIFKPALKTSIHIYGATRQKAVQLKSTNRAGANKEAAALWEKMKHKYGFQDDIHLPVNPDRRVQEDQRRPGSYSLFYRTLLTDAMLPIISRVLSGRGESPTVRPVQESVKSAVGVMLTDLYEPCEAARHQHYICDRLAHICDVDLQNSDLIDLRILKTWKPFVESGIGFLGRRNQTFLNLLDCGRFLDAKNLPVAFALGGAVLSIEGLFAEAIASRLQLEAANLSPDTFRKLCQLLATQNVFEKRASVPADRFASSRPAAANQSNFARKSARPDTRPSKPTYRPRVDPRVAKELVGCFDTQASASPAASKPTTANAIGPATREQFKEFAKCWKIRRFSNDLDYQAMNVTWHSMPGYYVRKSIKGKITVFAKLDQVAPSGLEGFIFPDNPNLFSATGELCGMEYAP